MVWGIRAAIGVLGVVDLVGHDAVLHGVVYGACYPQAILVAGYLAIGKTVVVRVYLELDPPEGVTGDSAVVNGIVVRAGLHVQAVGVVQYEGPTQG